MRERLKKQGFTEGIDFSIDPESNKATAVNLLTYRSGYRLVVQDSTLKTSQYILTFKKAEKMFMQNIIAQKNRQRIPNLDTKVPKVLEKLRDKNNDIKSKYLITTDSYITITEWRENADVYIAKGLFAKEEHNVSIQLHIYKNRELFHTTTLFIPIKE